MNRTSLLFLGVLLIFVVAYLFVNYSGEPLVDHTAGGSYEEIGKQEETKEGRMIRRYRPNTVLTSTARVPKKASTGMRCEMVDGVQLCGECANDSTCPEGTGCVFSADDRADRCLPSNCKRDDECGMGRMCLLLSKTGDTEVRRCAAVGDKKLNEACLFGSTQGAESCDLGLTCWDGKCRPSCQDASCPKDSFCQPFAERKICVEGCESTGCADGYACENHRCVQGDCVESGCPSGQRCDWFEVGNRKAFRCTTPCDLMKPCGEGQVCNDVGICQAACNPKDPRCPKTEVCAAVDEEKTLFACTPG